MNEAIKADNWRMHDLGIHHGIQLGYQGADREEWSGKLVPQPKKCPVTVVEMKQFLTANSTVTDDKGQVYMLGTVKR